MYERDSEPLYSLTIGEYIELNQKIFSDEAAKLLKIQANEKPKEEAPDIIFINEVMKLTGYRKTTIYSKISRSEFPVLSRGKPLTFSRQAILEWMRDGKPNLIDQKAEKYISDNMT